MITAPFLGILMLETRFPRQLGDIGNAESWEVPVRYRVIEGATAERIVTDAPLPEALLEPFVAAGQALIDDGAAALTTSCGFLSPWQDALQARLPVPLVTSALQLVPEVEAALPEGRRAGVITIDANRLTVRHLTAVGAPADTPFIGLESGRELHRAILGDLTELDSIAAEADVLDAGVALRALAPDLGAVVLECTNLPPYADALGRRLGLPVHHILDAGHTLYRQAAGQDAD